MLRRRRADNSDFLTMRTFAIGDIQGCYVELQRLLKAVGFVSGEDRLWFVGDLVNRGPDSASVIRLLRDLGEDVVCVLGNHDLHLLAVAYGFAEVRKKDTLNNVLDAPDADELIDWLHDLPLAHSDSELNALLVHAGLYPGWSPQQALLLADEISRPLRRREPEVLFRAMYGNNPAIWRDDLVGSERLRFIINAFTRMRMIDTDLALELNHKGPPGDVTNTDGIPLRPWFKVANGRAASRRIIFGHWSALGAGTFGNAISLDSGCVWGNSLTAVRIDSDLCEFTSVKSALSGRI